MVWALYSLYFNPQLIFSMTKWENIPRKSVKEESFLTKLNFMFVFNFALAPWIGGAFILSFRTTQLDLPQLVSVSLAGLYGFYTRVIC